MILVSSDDIKCQNDSSSDIAWWTLVLILCLHYWSCFQEQDQHGEGSNVMGHHTCYKWSWCVDRILHRTFELFPDESFIRKERQHCFPLLNEFDTVLFSEYFLTCWLTPLKHLILKLFNQHDQPVVPGVPGTHIMYVL